MPAHRIPYRIFAICFPFPSKNSRDIPQNFSITFFPAFFIIMKMHIYFLPCRSAGILLFLLPALKKIKLIMRGMTYHEEEQTYNGSDHRKSAGSDFSFLAAARIRHIISATVQLCGYSDRRTVSRCFRIGRGRFHLFPAFSDIGIRTGCLHRLRYSDRPELRREKPR